MDAEQRNLLTQRQGYISSSRQRQRNWNLLIMENLKCIHQRIDAFICFDPAEEKNAELFSKGLLVQGSVCKLGNNKRQNKNISRNIRLDVVPRKRAVSDNRIRMTRKKTLKHIHNRRMRLLGPKGIVMASV